MDWWTSLFLGLVQGITEFLPVSSSGHLSVFQRLLGVDLESRILFDVLLHTGTLFAVCIAYRQDIAALWRGFLAFFRKDSVSGTEALPAQRMILLLVIATLPLVLVVLFKDMLEALTGNMYFIGGALLVTSALLFGADRCKKGRKEERSARLTDALLVGCAQVAATIPGLSRSGTTISMGLFRGFERSFSVRFSFLMSLPAVLGATLLEVIGLFRDGADASELAVYVPGVLAAALAGYFSILFVRRMTQKGRFGGFVIYTLLAGIAVLLYAFLG